MGGGDLNSKKSWHPNTMKNQERVWKAEQAAAEEKKRIVELQRERAGERDRAELNDLAKRNTGATGDDNRLHWMYDKPDKKVQHEDYLLGKAIDKNYDQLEKSDDVIPAVARRVVGSSMLATAGDTQVDLARKIREDPLLLVKDRERAARAALLNNPLQRRRLAELLRKEQEQKKESKSKKKAKKKDKNLDNMLAAKLNAIGGEKGIDLAALLASDDSSSDSSSEEEQSKRKKKKKKNNKDKLKKSKERKKSNHSPDTDSSEDNKNKKKKSKSKDRRTKLSKEIMKSSHSKDSDSDTSIEKKSKYKLKHQNRKQNVSPQRQYQMSRKRRSESFDSDNEITSKKSKRDTFEERKRDDHATKTRLYPSSYKDKREGRRISRSPQKYKRNEESQAQGRQKRGGVNEEERAARLAAMVAAGEEREVQRGRRVAQQRAADAAAERAAPASRRHAAGSEARALPDSLESRIHSNRHYIQRDGRHMNEHFARR